MKRNVLRVLNSLMLSTAIVLGSNLAIVANAEARSRETSKFDLAHLARQGFFKEENIPSHSVFCSAVKDGKIQAKDIVEAAIAKNKLSPEKLNDESYLNRMEMVLRSSCQRI